MRTATTLLALLCTAFAMAQVPTELNEPVAIEIAAHSSSLHEDMVIYPNPASTTLHVRSDERSLVRMPVEIRTLDGRLVRMDSLSAQHELDVSRLPEGWYRLYLLDLSGVRGHRVFQVQR